MHEFCKQTEKLFIEEMVGENHIPVAFMFCRLELSDRKQGLCRQYMLIMVGQSHIPVPFMFCKLELCDRKQGICC